VKNSLRVLQSISSAVIVLLILSVGSTVCAQETETSTKTAPANQTTQTSPPKKRPDLNSLIKLTGQKALDFVAADMSGTEYTLEKLGGKIVVINLWATWCKPCVEEMPQLNSLVEKYKDQDVVFLGATAEPKILVESFLQKNSFAYQILPNAPAIIRQYSPKEKTDPVTGKARTIQALPTHIVIDREGTIVKHEWGMNQQTVPQLAQTIEQILAPK
jgi:peroxiredoxin